MLWGDVSDVSWVGDVGDVSDVGDVGDVGDCEMRRRGVQVKYVREGYAKIF